VLGEPNQEENMGIIVKVAAVVAMAGLAGCVTTPVTSQRPATSAEAAKVKAVIVGNLRDPDSAKFRGGVRAYVLQNGETAYCTDVNAKNGMGGMVGFGPAAVNMAPNRAPLVWIGDLGAYECGNLARGVSAR
jgi:hypothetical protein